MSGLRLSGAPGFALVLAVALGASGCAAGVPARLGPQTASDARLNPAAPLWRQQAPKRFYLRFETSKGVFVVEAERKWAPHGADRLYHMAQTGLLDDSRFFRVRPREFAQFGIAGDPAVANAWRDAKLPDDPRVLSNVRGTLAYAMAGANTRGTQVFINVKDHPDYDRDGFTPVARVVSGMSVVDALYAGYGDASGGGIRAGAQGPLFEGGNVQLDRDFPRLDKIISIRIVASPEESERRR
jgi:peptidyl-prolyl cis-trans isomerase A (cyclophilin A)